MSWPGDVSQRKNADFDRYPSVLTDQTCGLDCLASTALIPSLLLHSKHDFRKHGEALAVWRDCTGSLQNKVWFSSLKSCRGRTSSKRFCMINRPRPSGTSFWKTSEKFLETCLKVLSMASSLRWSSTSINSVIDSAERSSSSLRSVSLSLCSVNYQFKIRGQKQLKGLSGKEISSFYQRGPTFWYCSKAFLLTWANFLSDSVTLWRFFTNWDRMRMWQNKINPNNYHQHHGVMTNPKSLSRHMMNMYLIRSLSNIFLIRFLR